MIEFIPDSEKISKVKVSKSGLRVEIICIDSDITPKAIDKRITMFSARKSRDGGEKPAFMHYFENESRTIFILGADAYHILQILNEGNFLTEIDCKKISKCFNPEKVTTSELLEVFQQSSVLNDASESMQLDVSGASSDSESDGLRSNNPTPESDEEQEKKKNLQLIRI